MDKNQVTGWVLIALIVGGFIFYQTTLPPVVQNDKVENTDQQTDQNSGQNLTTSSQNKSTSNSSQGTNSSYTFNGSSDSASLALDSIKQIYDNQRLIDEHGIFHTAVNGEDSYVVIENTKLKLWISKKGGYLAKALLKNFGTYNDYMDGEDKELILFNKDSSVYELLFQHADKNFTTKDYYFSSSADSLYVDENNQNVVLTMQASNGGKIEFVYDLTPNEYMLNFNINVIDLNKHISGENQKMWFSWEQFAPKQEKSLKLERQIASVFYYNDEEGRDYLSETSESDNTIFEGNLKWISFKQQFFSSVLISEGNEIKNAQMSVNYKDEDTTYVKKFETKFGLDLLSNSVANANFKMYLGPNDFNRLSSYEGFHLQEQLNLGWGIFKWVNEYFIYPIFRFILSMGLSVGLGIILLTFAIKLILFPITYKNYLSSAKMRVIKPHLEKINEENKDADPLKKQQAVMALYKQTGVNPLAGCIPALLQMPILIALYRLFPAAIELRHASFLWAEDLSSFDSILDLPFTIWGYGNHVSLFTLLMAISMFFYMRFNQQMTPTPSASGGGDMQQAIQKNMKFMMNIMPFVMLFMFNGFAAGLSFYYFLANMITIGQTLVIKNFIINEERILDKINSHMSKPMQKSKWQKKLEEIQAKQKR